MPFALCRVRLVNMALPLAAPLFALSCAPTPIVPRDTPIAHMPPTPVTVSPRGNGRRAPEQPTSAPIIREDRGANVVAAAVQNRPQTDESGDVMLNYVDADIREIVRMVMGDILKLNYTIEPGFQGNVTIQTAQP